MITCLLSSAKVFSSVLWLGYVPLELLPLPNYVAPWYAPELLIPLAGMIFANAMNAVSIAAERYQAEIDNGRNPNEARHLGMQATMIPQVNSLMAVGLVSLPGMMTGQVLSGVSPLIAARYQILVMCMLFAASGISAACFLTLWMRRSQR